METVTLTLGQFFLTTFLMMVLASVVTVAVMYGYYRGQQ